MCFRWFHTCAEDLGPSRGVGGGAFLITVVIQRSAARSADSVSAFFFLFFLLSLLPHKLASRSFYNLDLPYHVTVQTILKD